MTISKVDGVDTNKYKILNYFTYTFMTEIGGKYAIQNRFIMNNPPSNYTFP